MRAIQTIHMWFPNWSIYFREDLEVGYSWGGWGVTSRTSYLVMYDCGMSLNPAMDLGQIECSFIQGIGFFINKEHETKQTLMEWLWAIAHGYTRSRASTPSQSSSMPRCSTPDTTRTACSRQKLRGNLPWFSRNSSIAWWEKPSEQWGRSLERSWKKCVVAWCKILVVSTRRSGVAFSCCAASNGKS